MPPKKKSAKKAGKPKSQKTIGALTHEDATRKNIPSVEMQPVISDEIKAPIPVTYPRGQEGLEEEEENRNPDLDPQLIWEGKTRDPLVVPAPPLFIQENVHRVRELMDEVFGEENFVCQINYAKTTGFTSASLASVNDYLVWYSRKIDNLKFRPSLQAKSRGGEGKSKYRKAETIRALQNYPIDHTREAVSDQLTSQGAAANSVQRFEWFNTTWDTSLSLPW